LHIELKWETIISTISLLVVLFGGWWAHEREQAIDNSQIESILSELKVIRKELLEIERKLPRESSESKSRYNGGNFMAKIALQKIIWQGTPKVDKDGIAITKRIHGVDTGEPDVERVVIPAGGAVPKTVPIKQQDRWQAEGLVRDDPSIEAPESADGPPDMLLPLVDPRRII
jgi:hypothetical protein